MQHNVHCKMDIRFLSVCRPSKLLHAAHVMQAQQQQTDKQACSTLVVALFSLTCRRTAVTVDDQECNDKQQGDYNLSVCCRSALLLVSDPHGCSWLVAFRGRCRQISNSARACSQLQKFRISKGRTVDQLTSANFSCCLFTAVLLLYTASLQKSLLTNYTCLIVNLMQWGRQMVSSCRETGGSRSERTATTPSHKQAFEHSKNCFCRRLYIQWPDELYGMQHWLARNLGVGKRASKEYEGHLFTLVAYNIHVALVFNIWADAGASHPKSQGQFQEWCQLCTCVLPHHKRCVHTPIRDVGERCVQRCEGIFDCNWLVQKRRHMQTTVRKERQHAHGGHTGRNAKAPAESHTRRIVGFPAVPN